MVFLPGGTSFCCSTSIKRHKTGPLVFLSMQPVCDTKICLSTVLLGRLQSPNFVTGQSYFQTLMGRAVMDLSEVWMHMDSIYLHLTFSNTVYALQALSLRLSFSHKWAVCCSSWLKKPAALMLPVQSFIPNRRPFFSNGVAKHCAAIPT